MQFLRTLSVEITSIFFNYIQVKILRGQLTLQIQPRSKETSTRSSSLCHFLNQNVLFSQRKRTAYYRGNGWLPWMLLWQSHFGELPEVYCFHGKICFPCLSVSVGILNSFSQLHNKLRNQKGINTKCWHCYVEKCFKFYFFSLYLLSCHRLFLKLDKFKLWNIIMKVQYM